MRSFCMVGTIKLFILYDRQLKEQNEKLLAQRHSEKIAGRWEQGSNCDSMYRLSFF